MKFLGTGAGEGTPNPFCSCRICENARKIKGREVRTRSSFMLSYRTVIDIGADFFAQSVLYEASFAKVENVIYTHMHDDHINYTMIWERLARRSAESHLLKIYVTEDAYNFFEDFYLNSKMTEGGYLKDNAEIIKMEFGKKYEVDGFSVTPFKASHKTVFEKNGANYLIERDSKKLYYALDSGYFLNETFEALKDEELDVFIGECTFPVYGENYVKEDSGHMDLDMFDKNIRKLLDIKAVTKETRIYITHVSPFGMTHSELEEYLKKYDEELSVCAAYDGMEIVL